MKTFAIICTICLTALTPSLIHAQRSLTILIGLHTNSREYNGAPGIHTALQYNIFTQRNFGYGLVIQDSKFASGRVAGNSHISSLNGYVSFPLMHNSSIRPYLKMELGAAYADAGPAAGLGSSLETRSTSTITSPIKFVSAQLAPAVGTQILLSRIFTLQVEYKRTLHYAHPLVSEGGYNFGTVDLGISYKFSSHGSKKSSYARNTRARCVTNKKTGATSCFKFR